MTRFIERLHTIKCVYRVSVSRYSDTCTVLKKKKSFHAFCFVVSHQFHEWERKWREKRKKAREEEEVNSCDKVLLLEDVPVVQIVANKYKWCKAINNDVHKLLVNKAHLRQFTYLSFILKVHYVVLGRTRSSLTDFFFCLNRLNKLTLFVFMTE